MSSLSSISLFDSKGRRTAEVGHTTHRRTTNYNSNARFLGAWARPGRGDGPGYHAGACLRRKLERCAAAPAPAPALLRDVLFARCLKVWARAGGFFGKERHIPPAAGKQPHITFILMDD